MYQATLATHQLIMPLLMGQVVTPAPPQGFQFQPGVGNPFMQEGERLLLPHVQLSIPPNGIISTMAYETDGPMYRVQRGNVVVNFRFDNTTQPGRWMIATGVPTPNRTFTWEPCGTPNGLFPSPAPNSPQAWINRLSNALGSPPVQADRDFFQNAANVFHDGTTFLSSRFRMLERSPTARDVYVLQTNRDGPQLFVRWDRASGEWQWVAAAPNIGDNAPATGWAPLSTAPGMTMPATLRTELGWDGPQHNAKVDEAWRNLTGSLTWARTGITQLADPATRATALATMNDIRGRLAFLQMMGVERDDRRVPEADHVNGLRLRMYQPFSFPGTPENFLIMHHRATGVFHYSTNNGTSWQPITSSTVPFPGAGSSANIGNTDAARRQRANYLVQTLGQNNFPSGQEREDLQAFHWVDQLVRASGGRRSSNQAGMPVYTIVLPNDGEMYIRSRMSGNRVIWEFVFNNPNITAIHNPASPVPGNDAWRPIAQLGAQLEEDRMIREGSRPDPRWGQVRQLGTAINAVFPPTGSTPTIANRERSIQNAFAVVLQQDHFHTGGPGSDVQRGFQFFHQAPRTGVIPTLPQWVSIDRRSANDADIVDHWRVVCNPQTGDEATREPTIVDFRCIGEQVPMQPPGTYNYVWQWRLVPANRLDSNPQTWANIGDAPLLATSNTAPIRRDEHILFINRVARYLRALAP